MELNQQISLLVNGFKQSKQLLKKELLPIISMPLFYNEYDGETPLSEMIRIISKEGMTSDLIQDQKTLFELSVSFENKISEINDSRILQNVKKQKEIEILADAFYAEAKKLFSQMPKSVLRENASITFPIKRLEGNLEQILIESFNDLGLKFEKKGNCYHGYYFSLKNIYDGKNEKVNFQKFENIKKKLSLLIEIKTDGDFPDASRFMTNNFTSDSIYGFESPEQEELSYIVKAGPKALYT